MQLATVSTAQSRSGGESPLHWNSAHVEHYPQNTMMASYCDMEMKMFVTPTSEQLGLGPMEA